MSEISLLFLLKHAGGRILEFFRHWYVDGFLRAGGWTLSVLERLDRIFAVRINFNNLFKPLYQDYTFIGYIWGFVFRSARAAVGGLLYLFLVLLAIGLYLAWAFAPIYIIFKIFFNGH